MKKKDMDMDEIHRRIAKIYPVVQANGNLFRIKNVHPTNECFTWAPDTVAMVEGLVDLTRIVTEHSCGFTGLFKPTIAEVVSQIPDDLIDNVVAFRTVVETCVAHPDGRYHSAITILFTGTNVNPVIVPKMKLYTCTDHECHWPVGVASIVVAACEDDARKLLYTTLEASHLTKHEDFTLNEISMDTPSAHVLNDGEY